MATQRPATPTPADVRKRKHKQSTTSNWRSVRMPHHGAVARTLQQRYSLRWHGLLIGSFTLLLMWCTSHLQMLLGVDKLSVRYLVTLSVGYLAYLLVLRTWAARLVERKDQPDDSGGDFDVPDISWPSGNSSSGGAQAPMPRGGGSASVDFGGSSDAGGSALGDLASGAAEAVGSADEGAVVVVPVVAIFLIGAALVFGAGSLAMLFFGWDVLLTVAVELAFSVATARAAVGVEREGWLTAAVRLTWKPLLGAVICAVLLGASIDHFLPGVQSLPQAVRLLQGG